MKKFRIALVLMVACVALAFGGTAPTGGDGPLDIVFITKSYQHSFFEYMRVAAEEMAAREGFNLTYFAPTKPYNLEEQTRLVDDAVARGVDGIALVPVDSVGMVPAVERANAAGIPVAIINTKLQGGDIVTFAAIENYDAMVQITEYMMEKLNYEGKVILIEGSPGSQTSIDRVQAMHDVTAKYPGIEVLASQTANFDRAEGMALMENLLQTFPEIDAVIAANFPMAMGAIEALRAAGRLDGVLVSGFDFLVDGIAAIAAGEAVATIDQNPEAQATEAIAALIKHINGEQVPEYIQIDGVMIDASNVADFLDKE